MENNKNLQYTCVYWAIVFYAAAVKLQSYTYVFVFVLI